MSYLDGKIINDINSLLTKYNNGNIVSLIELWVTGGVISLDEATSKKVEGFMRDARRIGADSYEYVRYSLIEEGIL